MHSDAAQSSVVSNDPRETVCRMCAHSGVPMHERNHENMVQERYAIHSVLRDCWRAVAESVAQGANSGKVGEAQYVNAMWYIGCAADPLLECSTRGAADANIAVRSCG